MQRIYSLVMMLALSTSVALGQMMKPQSVPGELIVQAAPGKDLQDLEHDLAVVNGQATGLRVVRLLSGPMRAWLVRFDATAVAHRTMSDAVFSHRSVSLVQDNHYIQQRVVPNDTEFNQQWQHVNNGGGGGTADADVDSDLAWDITTGGLTTMGDTIVVCIVDDGTNLSHPDLLPNSWFNHNEIPNNNVDDDNNGYVDDYRGWNITNNSDNVTGGSHGVNVNGMIGAVGNNNQGVVGVNWAVKMMTVKHGGIDEASVIEGYTYPLVMRQMYESSNGQQGAFVVATNSSWGIDGGQPSDSPLWCAFYDTLGYYGILSAGSTANNNVNIDQVGDLPTACESGYLISVTASNNDDVRTFSGYGQTTIDLAAPGENVRTTSGSSSYTTTSGTSFAGPMVAGAVALMYSAPCASLAAIAHASPSVAAEMVRDYILNGVDPKPNLTTECVTGGRLNLKNSLDLVLQNCSGSECLAPFNLTTTTVTSTQVIYTWGHLPDQDTFNFQFGMVGSQYAYVTGITDDYHPVNQLQPCAQWGFLVQAVCDGVAGPWSDTLFVTTDGCCTAPTGLTLDNNAGQSAILTWDAVTAATSYELRYRETGTSTWTTVSTISLTNETIIDLTLCTEYEVQVASNCNGGTTAFSQSIIFLTVGCGACTDFTYCAVDGNTQFEWIAKVTIGSFVNQSNGASAYSDYTGTVIDLPRDSVYNIALQPGYAAFPYTERFTLWIDLNMNGTFEAAEKLFASPSGTTTSQSGTISIPLSAQLGITRLRVGMTDNSGFPFAECDALDYGEWEDYCVRILEAVVDTDTTGITDLSALWGLSIYPVPAHDAVTIEAMNHREPLMIRMSDMKGRLVREASAANGRAVLPVGQLPAGVYVVSVADRSGHRVHRKVVVE